MILYFLPAAIYDVTNWKNSKCGRKMNGWIVAFVIATLILAASAARSRSRSGAYPVRLAEGQRGVMATI